MEIAKKIKMVTVPLFMPILQRTIGERGEINAAIQGSLEAGCVRVTERFGYYPLLTAPGKLQT